MLNVPNLSFFESTLRVAIAINEVLITLLLLFLYLQILTVAIAQKSTSLNPTNQLLHLQPPTQAAAQAQRFAHRRGSPGRQPAGRRGARAAVGLGGAARQRLALEGMFDFFFLFF